MSPNPPVFILRHAKERLAKCSLRGLEKRADLRFFRYPEQVNAFFAELGAAGEVNVLALGGEPLSRADRHNPLVLVDGTWRLAAQIATALDIGAASAGWTLRTKSLPGEWLSAYPRRQSHCPEPERGLASFEALFIALRLLGHKGLDPSLYRWWERFEEQNRSRLNSLNHLNKGLKIEMQRSNWL